VVGSRTGGQHHCSSFCRLERKRHGLVTNIGQQTLHDEIQSISLSVAPENTIAITFDPLTGIIFNDSSGNCTLGTNSCVGKAHFSNQCLHSCSHFTDVLGYLTVSTSLCSQIDPFPDQLCL